MVSEAHVSFRFQKPFWENEFKKRNWRNDQSAVLTVTKAVQLTAMMIAFTWTFRARKLKRHTHAFIYGGFFFCGSQNFYQLPRNAVVVIFAFQHSCTQYTPQCTARRRLLYVYFFIAYVHPLQDLKAIRVHSGEGQLLTIGQWMSRRRHKRV